MIHDNADENGSARGLLLSNCLFYPLPMPRWPVAIDHTLIIVVLAKSCFKICAFTETVDQSAHVRFDKGSWFPSTKPFEHGAVPCDLSSIGSEPSPKPIILYTYALHEEAWKLA